MAINKTKLNVLLFCTVCTLAYSIYYSGKIHFEDTAFFGGDTWEYQSMAVNWITGHGLSFGGYEPMSVYKFSKTGSDVTVKQESKYLSFLHKSPPKEDLYRTPGYPVFLGIIYKIFGISPAVAKQVQLQMLVTVAGFLPALGWYYWKKQGLAAGLIAGFIFLGTYAVTYPVPNMSHPGDLLAEPLITFVMFLTAVFSVYWNKNRTPGKSFGLGILIGLSLLIKASNLYIPLLYVFYFGYEYLKKRLAGKNITALIAGIILLTIPWSAYVSVKTGTPVLLSTQGQNALLETNNEFTSDGRWHPEGFSTGINAYYQQPWIQKYPDGIKVAIFYYQHPGVIPSTVFHKLDNAFSGFPFFILLILMLIYFQITGSIKNAGMKIAASVPIIYFSVMSLFFPFTITAINFDQPLLWLYHSPVLLLILAAAAIHSCLKKNNKHYVIPAPFIILFLNFFFITITIFGLPRYVQVIDFIFILTAIRYTFVYIQDLMTINFRQIGL